MNIYASIDHSDGKNLYPFCAIELSDEKEITRIRITGRIINTDNKIINRLKTRSVPLFSPMI